MSYLQRPNQPPIYRAFRVSPEGRISEAAVQIDAADDDEAIAQARQLVDGVGIEVWDRARLVIALPPKD